MGELEQAEWRDNDCLGDVLRRHGDLKVPFAEVQLTKQLAAVQASCQISHIRQGVFILHRLQVQLAVIAAGPPGAVFLLHHVEQAAPLAGREVDDALF
jgi:hypothetical protein